MRRHDGIKALLGVLLVTLLSACTNNSGYADLDKFMAQARSKPRGHVQPLPEFKSYQSFTYSAAGRRAPFEPPAEVKLADIQQQKSTIKPDFNRPKEVLEHFDLTNLHMVGTIRKDGSDHHLWALVSDGQGGIHRVKVGNHMGKNYGRIMAITDTRIDLVEIVPNGHGGWVKRPRTLKLSEK